MLQQLFREGKFNSFLLLRKLTKIKFQTWNLAIFMEMKKCMSIFYPESLWTTVEIFRGFGKGFNLSTTDTDLGWSPYSYFGTKRRLQFGKDFCIFGQTFQKKNISHLQQMLWIQCRLIHKSKMFARLGPFNSSKRCATLESSKREPQNPWKKCYFW